MSHIVSSSNKAAAKSLAFFLSDGFYLIAMSRARPVGFPCSMIMEPKSRIQALAAPEMPFWEWTCVSCCFWQKLAHRPEQLAS